MSLQEKLALMKTPKFTRLGGHSLTLYLTRYNEAEDTYDGHTIRDYSMNTGDNPPIITSHKGFRLFPSGEKDFQFCELDDLESQQKLLALEDSHADKQINPTLYDPANVQDRIDQFRNKNKDKKNKSKL